MVTFFERDYVSNQVDTFIKWNLFIEHGTFHFTYIILFYLQKNFLNFNYPIITRWEMEAPCHRADDQEHWI